MKYTISFTIVAGLMLQIYAGIILYQTNKQLDKDLKDTLKVAEQVRQNYDDMNNKLKKLYDKN